MAKTYRVRLSDVNVSPQQVIKTWRENFGKFWTPGNIFLDRSRALPLAKCHHSTDVRVIYVDVESFSFMTPPCHMYAAFITFSAYDDDGSTVVQVQPLMRASDPIYEIGMRIGYADKVEDEFWHATLINIAKHFGAQGQVIQQVACIDPRWQWKYVGNIWNNAAIRTALYTPVRLVKRLFTKAN